VAAQAAETLSMGPAKSLAGEFAATAGMHHMQPLHANIPPMHATRTLTWYCCGKAQATKEWQLMAHAQEQGRAACAAQVDNGVDAMSITVSMQNSGVQESHVALWYCLLTAQSAHKDQPVPSVCSACCI
jgi:hypothetical protein